MLDSLGLLVAGFSNLGIMPDTAASHDQSEQIAASIAETLSKHGYAFQQAVLEQAAQLADARKSAWVLHVCEYPIDVRGKTSRVDFVLRHHSKPLYLVAECKRVDPAFGWCFSKLPYVRRNSSEREVVVDYVRCPDEHTTAAGRASLKISSDAIFHLALSFKLQAKGDGTGGRGQDEIEKAATQAFLGVNGLAQEFARHRDLVGAKQRALLIPVVFTSAPLYDAGADLSSASVSSGRVASEDIKPQPLPWLWLRYNVSPHLCHGLGSEAVGGELGEPANLSSMLDREYARTLAIVSPSGVEEFLNYLSKYV